MLFRVDLHVPHPNRPDPHFVDFALGERAAAQRRPNSGDEFTQSVWLDDVVVGANFETHHRVDLRALRRHHDDRHLALLPNFTTDVGARDFRQHHVKEHDVGSHALEIQQCLSTIARYLHAKTFALESDVERFDEGVFVLNNEDGRRVLGCAHKMTLGVSPSFWRARNREAPLSSGTHPVRMKRVRSAMFTAWSPIRS